MLGLWGDVAARECGGDAFAAAPGLALLLLRTERAAGSEPWRGHLDEARRVPKGPVVCAALADLADAAAPRACREVLEAAVRRADACRRAAPAQPPGPTRVDSRTDVARGHGGFRDYWAAVPFADRAAVCAAAAHAPPDGCDDAGVLGRLVDDAAQRPRAASAARDAAVRHRVLSRRRRAPGGAGRPARRRRRGAGRPRGRAARRAPPRLPGARGALGRAAAALRAGARRRALLRLRGRLRGRGRGRRGARRGVGGDALARATATTPRPARSSRAPSSRPAGRWTTAPRATATTPSRS